MERSTIYARCPACGDQTLVTEKLGALSCAACAFDYTTLAQSPEKLEGWIADRLREGPMGQLSVMYVYPRIVRKPQSEVIAHVREIAAKAGVKLPDPATGLPGWIVFVIIAVVLGVVGTIGLVVLTSSH